MNKMSELDNLEIRIREGDCYEDVEVKDDDEGKKYIKCESLIFEGANDRLLVSIIHQQESVELMLVDSLAALTIMKGRKMLLHEKWWAGG